MQHIRELNNFGLKVHQSGGVGKGEEVLDKLPRHHQFVEFMG